MNKTIKSQSAPVNLEVDLRQQDQDGASGGIVSLEALFRTLWRGKIIILLIMAVALLLGGYYAYVAATPLFKSTAVVMLETREEQVVDLESVVSGLSADASVVNSEVEVLKSRSLLGKVVDELNLQEDQEFNRLLRPFGWFDRTKFAIRDQLGIVREPLTSTDEERVARNRQAAIDGLLETLSIRNIPQSLVFQVTSETTNGMKSALVANTVVELYILNQLQVKFDATEQATKWLSERVAELQVSLEAAEGQVKAFRSSTDLVSPEALEGLEFQLKELRERIADTKSVEASAQNRLTEIKRAQTPQAKLDVTNDAQLRRLIARLDQSGIEDAFNIRFDQIVTRAQLEVDRATSQIGTMTTSLVDLEQQINAQSTDLIALQQLNREAEASRLLYEYFLSRLKETSAQQGIQQADSRVLSSAVIPTQPSAPRKSLIVIVTGLLGFMIGAALVLLRESQKNTFRSADDLERMSKYPVIGQLPLLPIRRRRDAVGYLADKPTSAAAEAVRNLRTSVLLSNVDLPPKVIMTCSSFPGEGKTTIALALAQNMSKMGKRVLLIEGDVRRRVFGQYFDDNREIGLVKVLTGDVSLEDAVIRESRIGSDVLLADKASENAADLFSSERFGQLIEETRELYDHIIIDTPPVLVVPDARIIAQYADAIAFVVHWDKTIKPAVIDALRQFESVNKPVSGLVLNQINLRSLKRYGYGGKYGAYSAYGSKYYTN